MTEVKEITTEEAYSSFVSSFPSSSLLVIYFYASWAQPCKQMSAVLEALASTYPVESPPTIGFISMDAEELSSIAEEHDVTAVPFVVLQKDGKTLESVSGSDAGKVRAAVEKYAAQPEQTNGFSIPPAQKVTRPTEEREPAPAPTGAAVPSTTGASSGASKDLSAYVPPADAPATAPEVTGGEVDKEALFKRLEQLVKAAPVMLFMKGIPASPQCGFSRQLVAMLRERSIRYGFFNILADDEVRQGLKEFSDWPTFPQLYVEGELIGGLDIVKEELNNNPEFMMNYAVKGPEATAA
ncbi:monothiol glutaredoxin-4 [Microthyrium microscopicum]|uniref:Monothiol glutaredoxin-4 n=1 Tax=Microthyrium microscopicum TaxID=703497 RepID=A0A6A6UTP8_9PEZI|nr:monothiol glutaredoxin-4 [Microthyrium microscopicum]